MAWLFVDLWAAVDPVPVKYTFLKFAGFTILLRWKSEENDYFNQNLNRPDQTSIEIFAKS